MCHISQFNSNVFAYTAQMLSSYYYREYDLVYEGHSHCTEQDIYIYILLLPLVSVLFSGLESTINICDLHFSLNEL